MRPLYLYYRPARDLWLLTATQHAQDARRRLKNQLATADSGARGGEGLYVLSGYCTKQHCVHVLSASEVSCHVGLPKDTHCFVLSSMPSQIKTATMTSWVGGAMGTLPGVLLNRSQCVGAHRQPGPESASRPQPSPAMHALC